MATTSYKQPTKVANPPAGRMTSINELDAGAANVDKSNAVKATKTSGIKIRGTGAATKGTMARGPMA